MRYLTFLLIFITINLFAQRGEEGITPNVVPDSSVTRAVIIGISTYKHPEWNLKYAHSDAQKYAGFLASDLGGKLSKEALYLITDSLATSNRIKTAINKLAEASKTNDELIMFFAGHGVQESETSPSYLITYETPFENNFNSGSIPFDFIHSIIDSLTQKKVKVTLIADVCRSGNFASFSKENQKRAAVKLLELQNEVRMMSCLPDEVSYEDDTWKGGVFTYFLLEGLMGKADEIVPNKKVSGRELERYVPFAVALEVERFNNGRQTPQFILGKNGRKAFSFLEDFQKDYPKELLAHETGTKNLILEFLRFETNPRVNEIYLNFLNALAEDRIVYKKPNSALYLFEQLREEKSIKDFFPLISENFANKVLKEAKLNIGYFISEKENPISAAKCKELSEILSYTLKSGALNQNSQDEIEGLMHFYQGEYLKKKGEGMDYPNWQRDIELAFISLEKALVLNPEAAYLHHELGYLYMITEQFEKAEYHFLQAIKQSPTFSYSYINLGNVYHFTNQEERADSISKIAIKVNERNPVSLYNLGIILSRQGKINKATSAFKQTLKVDPNFIKAYHKLGFLYLERGALSEAYDVYQKAYALDKNALPTLFGMAQVQRNWRKWDASLKFINRCLEVEVNFIPAYFLASDIYLSTNQADSAIVNLEKVLSIQPNNLDAKHFLAFIYADQGAFDKAKEYCKEILATSPLEKKETYILGLKTINLLGLIFYSEKDMKMAKKVLESALPGANDYPKIYCNLALIYQSLRKHKEARKMTGKALVLGEECR